MTLAPRDVNANLGRGRVLEALGLNDQASDVYRDILTADGSNLEACLDEGRSLQGLKECAWFLSLFE